MKIRIGLKGSKWEKHMTTMRERIEFRSKVERALSEIDENTLAFSKNEYWMIFSIYEYLQYYAYEHQLWNMSIALPLARGIHDGIYRKSTITKNGSTYRLPYVIHCLLVCRMLVDLHVPLDREEEDILLASALCHDMIEDVPFPNKGLELVEKYHLDPRVYETVKLVTKRKDFTESEEIAHFKAIKENKLALLVKLSDRSHNVEDMYNMTEEKVHEYVRETNRHILPMCEYGFLHYPDLGRPFGVLKDKITCLTRTAEIMVNRYEERERELRGQLKELRRENEKLYETLHGMWER